MKPPSTMNSGSSVRRQPDRQAGVSQIRREEAGYARPALLQFVLVLFLVVELALAVTLGGLLGEEVARYFTGAWYRLVFWGLSIVITTTLCLTCLIGFSCLFNFLRRSDASKSPCEKSKPDIH